VRTLVIVALLAACGRDEPAPVAERAPSVAACFGDELGPLPVKWTEIDCEQDGPKCRDACSAGDANACFNLALELQESTGDESSNRQDIMSLFARTCSLGLALGCTNWGAGHLFNDEDPDVRCLYRVFAAACAVEETFGCSMMARILIEWPRTPFDPWIGYSQLVNACNRYDGPPCRFLAYHLELGKFGGADEVAIKLLLLRACDGGDVAACDRERAKDAMN
jgi:hypothetical protein